MGRAIVLILVLALIVGLGLFITPNNEERGAQARKNQLIFILVPALLFGVALWAAMDPAGNKSDALMNPSAEESKLPLPEDPRREAMQKEARRVYDTPMLELLNEFKKLRSESGYNHANEKKIRECREGFIALAKNFSLTRSKVDEAELMNPVDRETAKTIAENAEVSCKLYAESLEYRLEDLHPEETPQIRFAKSKEAEVAGSDKAAAVTAEFRAFADQLGLYKASDERQIA